MTEATRMEMPRMKILRVEDVKGAPFNPSKRLDRRRLGKLIRSLADVGLLYPILVDEHYAVIDGHRRLAAARELGWETIEARIVTGNRNQLYASVNETSAKLSGNETLAVWLSEPDAVSPRVAKTLTAMTESLGRVLVKKICEAGLSSRVWNTTCRIGRYLGDESKVFLQAVARWLVDVATIGQVMKALEAGVSSSALLRAIRNMKPLPLRQAEEVSAN